MTLTSPTLSSYIKVGGTGGRRSLLCFVPTKFPSSEIAEEERGKQLKVCRLAHGCYFVGISDSAAPSEKSSVRANIIRSIEKW